MAALLPMNELCHGGESNIQAYKTVDYSTVVPIEYFGEGAGLRL